MKTNTNTWNKIRYTIYTPFYDFIGKVFSSSRKKSIDNLNIKEGDKVLLIGAGTGLDIEFIPKAANVTATDITPAMINVIKKKYPDVKALVMDGHQLKFPDEHFDHIILHLILAVIPNPIKCIKEAERVLKPGGKIAVFDKFLDQDQKPSLMRRIFNLFTSTLFSDINRRLEDILTNTDLKITNMIPADLKGTFKIFVLEKE